jgi:hypothetical protein
LTIGRAWAWIGALALAGGMPGLGLTPTAHAQAAALRPTRRTVEIQIAADPGAEEAAEKSLLGPLRRLGLDVRAARGASFDPGSAAAPGVLARVFVDLRSTAPGVLLIVIDGPTGRIAARREILREGSGEVMREQAAFILESLIEAEIEADRAAQAPPVASSATPPVASSATPPAASSAAPAPPGSAGAPPAAVLGVAPFLSAGRLSSETGLNGGAGLAVGLTRGDGALGAWLLGRLLAPAHATTGGVDLRAGLFSARFLPTARLLGGAAVSLDLGVGGGFDLLSVSSSTSGDAVARPSSRQLSAVLSGMLRAQVQLSGNVQFFAAGLLDGDLTPRRFVVAQGTASQEILTPTPWRPSFLLGWTLALPGGLAP